MKDNKFDISIPVYVNDIPYLVQKNTKCCNEYANQYSDSDYKYCPVGSFSCPFQSEYYNTEICKMITENDWESYFDKFKNKG